MKIFISHAFKDKHLIAKITDLLCPYNVGLLVAEHYIDLQKPSTEKIEEMIHKCDIAIILLTENGFNSQFVQQEIGHIKSLNKSFIQLVEQGLEKRISGFNYGRDFIVYDTNLPDVAMQ